jgi:hypothetical protein
VRQSFLWCFPKKKWLQHLGALSFEEHSVAVKEHLAAVKEHLAAFAWNLFPM